MSKKILIAEDEKPLAKALKLKLTKEGYEADIAGNGVEAVEMATKNKYNLMLLDLMMPKKDGFEVLEDLKKAGVKTKILVTSNLSQEEDIKKAKSLGASDFFIKSDTSIIEIVKIVQKNLP